jgi:hypothetical protein
MKDWEERERKDTPSQDTSQDRLGERRSSVPRTRDTGRDAQRPLHAQARNSNRDPPIRVMSRCRLTIESRRRAPTCLESCRSDSDADAAEALMTRNDTDDSE